MATPTEEQHSNKSDGGKSALAAKAHTWFQKVGKPLNKVSNKLGAEAFWPTWLDEEAEKVSQ